MSPVAGLFVLAVLFLLGFPVPYAIAAAGVVIMQLSTGIKWMSITSNMINGINSFTILCIPLFLFAGKLMNSCGITDRLFKAARAIVGGVPGLLVIRRPLLCQNADPDKTRLRHGLLVVTEFQG